MHLTKVCENYFNGFNDLKHICSENNPSNRKILLTVAKIVSYFTLITPLIFGIIYAACTLMGRVSEPLDIGKKTLDIGKETLSELDKLNAFAKEKSVLLDLDHTKFAMILMDDNETEFSINAETGFININPTLLISDRVVDQFLLQNSPSNINESALGLLTFCQRATTQENRIIAAMIIEMRKENMLEEARQFLILHELSHLYVHHKRWNQDHTKVFNPSNFPYITPNKYGELGADLIATRMGSSMISKGGKYWRERRHAYFLAQNLPIAPPESSHPTDADRARAIAEEMERLKQV